MEQVPMQNLRDIRIKIDSFFTPALIAALILFIVNLFLVFNVLTPSFRDLNGWDESVYINTGKTLFEGTLPVFARNPLVGLLYAITYIPYQTTPFWLVESATLGRFFLFFLIWLSAFLVGSKVSKYASPLIIAAFVLVFPVLTDILSNPSDSLFAAMSGLSFWRVLSFHETQNIKHVWWASFFIGLAALSRNDGLISYGILAVLIIWLTVRFKFAWQWIPALLIPFALIVGGYQLFYGMRTGDYSLGTTERSYVAFLQGQQLVYEKDPECRFKLLRCAVFQAEKLYGSGEENNYSILRAIANNPAAYSIRLQAHFRKLPTLFLYSYGQRTIFLLLILALRGLVELVRKREYSLIALLVAWPAYLGVYFLTFFREGYLRTPFFIFFVFGAIGVQALAENLTNLKENRIWIIILTTATILAWFAGIQALYFTTFVLLVAVLVIPFFKKAGGQTASALLIFLLVGLILRPAFDPPIRKTLSEEPEVQGILALAQNLPPGSQVASGAPGAVWMARMEPVDVADLDYGDVTTPETLYEQLKKDGVDAVYVDSYFSNTNREIWRLIIPGIGKYYENIYLSPRGGNIQVFLLK
jgi:hypothetical protein